MPTYPIYLSSGNVQATIQSSAQVTAPTTGATITSVTLNASGVWEIWVHYYLGGTGQSAADTNNMKITNGSVDILSPILVPSAANSNPEDMVLSVQASKNDVIAVKAIANATGTVVYNVTIVAKLLNPNAP